MLSYALVHEAFAMLKRRKQRRKPRDEIIWYAMRVEAWNFDYHFGDVVFRHDPRNYREFSTYHKSAWLRDSPEKKRLVFSGSCLVRGPRAYADFWTVERVASFIQLSA